MTYNEYNEKQMVEMLKHKWIESEKAGKDLGELALIHWVQHHAKKFREECDPNKELKPDGKQ